MRSRRVIAPLEARSTRAVPSMQASEVLCRKPPCPVLCVDQGEDPDPSLAVNNNVERGTDSEEEELFRQQDEDVTHAAETANMHRTFSRQE
jgi:hypothetical protein